ncbi:MAG: hypothetical protein HY303_18895, partial [Candidatus Wallbacteria bacterium]|nr:hypothetical protein [Candidatus Wallbacteria bacterium]
TPPAARAGSTVTLDGTKSADPDGNALVYRWVQTAGLPITAASSRLARLSFTPPAAGVYKFRLFVDDGRDRSTPKEVTVNATDASGGGTTTRSTAAVSGGGGASCALGEPGRGDLAPFLYAALLLLPVLLLRRRGS